MILDGLPERLASHLQVRKRRAAHVQQGHIQRVGNQLQRLRQRLIQTRQRIRTGELQHLKDKAEQIVAFQQVGQVDNAARQVGEIHAREAVHFTRVTANAADS